MILQAAGASWRLFLVHPSKGVRSPYCLSFSHPIASTLCLPAGVPKRWKQGEKYMTRSMSYRLLATVVGLGTIVAAGEAYAAPGWQTPNVFNVPAGLHDLFFHRACPAAF